MRKGLHLFMVLMVTLSLIFTACSKAGQNTDGAAAGDNSGDSGGPKPITLTFWAGTGFKNVEGYDSPNYGDWEKAKAKEFMEKYPHVTINVETIAWKDIEQKVNVAVAGNNPPDILYDNVPLRVIKHAQNGILEPLDEVIAEDRDDWKESFLNMGSYEGTLYALPLASLPSVMFINQTLLEEKGLADLLPEDREWTWSEWEEAMEKVAGDGVYGTAFFAKNEQADQLMISYLSGSGAQWANEDFTEYTLNSAEAVEALEFMLELDKKGLVAPGAASLSANDTLELFKQGKLLTVKFMPNFYETIESGLKDGSVNPDVKLYGIVPVHKEGVEPRIYTTGENGYALFKQDDPEKRKMAIEFIKFLVQSENIQAISKSILGVPARYSAAYTSDNADYSALIEKINELEIVDLGKSVPWYSNVRQALYPNLQAAFLGAKTPQQALDDFVKQANQAARP